MKSIRTRIVVAVIGIAAIVVAGFGAIIFVRVTDADIARYDAQLASHAEKLKAELTEGAEDSIIVDGHALRSIQTDGIPRASVRLIDMAGVKLYEDTNAGVLPDFSYRRVGKASASITILVAGNRYRSFFLNLHSELGVHYLLEVAAPLEPIEARRVQLQWLLLITIPLMLFIIALFVSLIVFRSLRPLSSMITAAQSISAQTLHGRIDIPPSASEVEALASALNKMIARIDEGVHAQKQFIVDASHEIRTPISVIRAEIEYADRFQTNGEARESLAIALSEIDHLNTLASSLLTLASLDASGTERDFRPVSVTALLRECVQKLKSLAHKQEVSLMLHAEDALMVTGNEERLRSMLLNVLENGIKYNKPGGTVEVTLRRQHATAVIEVRDDGCGIEQEETPFIFNRFNRGSAARAEKEGCGLGLAIASRIAEFHHGSIRVESILGKGSTFTIELPLDRVSADK